MISVIWKLTFCILSLLKKSSSRREQDGESCASPIKKNLLRLMQLWYTRVACDNCSKPT